METSLIGDIAWAQNNTSFVQRDANNIETVLFTMSFAFVLYGHKAEECNMTWPIAHVASRCTVLTKCTGVSWKCYFLCIMRNFGYSLPTHMQILVGRVLHTSTESTLKISYLGCFCFFFLSYRGIWWREGDTLVQKENLWTCFTHNAVHETEVCTFWTIPTFVSVFGA